MSFLDRERNLVVLRVVYDGPPEAGKTTSLRALAGSLGQPLYTPVEQDGRTLYFDWMDYTGGRFEGYQIRCQIVSVPGQRTLWRRRRHLLKDADVVVHVADSTRDRLGQSLELLAELPEVWREQPGPRVGVILQANKRDRPDAVPLPEIRERLRHVGPGLGVVESVAADGTGIREAFVFAVRLALDRVREQIRTQSVPLGRPEADSGQALLEYVRRADDDPIAPAVPLLRQVLAENAENEEAPPPPGRAGDDVVPRPPDPSAPSGAIWPPVEGRLILHEAAGPARVSQRVAGGWVAPFGEGWRAFSFTGAVYSDLEAGRAVLIRWARLHAACADWLSPTRCIVLAATGEGRWRLWQIVRAERSLRDHLAQIASCPSDRAAELVVEAAALVCDLVERSAAGPCPLAGSLDSVGRGDRGAVYVGLMPMERLAASAEPGARITADLEAVLAGAFGDRRPEVLASLARLRDRRGQPARSARLERLLVRLTG